MESASRTAEFWSTSSAAAPSPAGARAVLEEDWADVDTQRRCLRAPRDLVDLEVLLRALAASEADSVAASAAAAVVSVEVVVALEEETGAARVGTAVAALAATADTEAGRASVTSLTDGVARRLPKELPQDLAAVAGLAATVGLAVATAPVAAMAAATAAAAAAATATGMVATGTAEPAAATGSLWARSASIATAIVRVGMAATTTLRASVATKATATKTRGASGGTERGLMHRPSSDLSRQRTGFVRKRKEKVTFLYVFRVLPPFPPSNPKKKHPFINKGKASFMRTHSFSAFESSHLFSMDLFSSSQSRYKSIHQSR